MYFGSGCDRRGVRKGDDLKIDRETMDKLRTGAITALDGLWFLAVESRMGFEAALEMDLEVWKAYGSVLLKRVARALGMELDPSSPPDMRAVCELLAAACQVDGTGCHFEMGAEGECVFTVHRCPWWENLRASGREGRVDCELVDNTVFREWLLRLDPSIEMEITRSMPRGDDRCVWILRKAGGAGRHQGSIPDGRK